MKVCWNVFTAQSMRRFISRHSCCNYLFTRGDFLRFYGDAIKKQHRRFVGSEKGKWSRRDESSVLVLIINSDTFSRYSSGHLRGSSRSRFPSARINLLQRRRKHTWSSGNSASGAAQFLWSGEAPYWEGPLMPPPHTPPYRCWRRTTSFWLFICGKKEVWKGTAAPAGVPAFTLMSLALGSSGAERKRHPNSCITFQYIYNHQQWSIRYDIYSYYTDHRLQRDQSDGVPSYRFQAPPSEASAPVIMPKCVVRYKQFNRVINNQ